MVDFEQALEMHRQGLIDQAETAFLAVLKAEPDHLGCLRSLARLYRQNGQLDKAVRLIARGLEIDPSSASEHNHLGAVYQQLGHLHEAQQFFKSALEQDANYVEAYLGLGSVFQAMGETEEAEACFRQALRINPDFAEANINLGLLLRQRAQYGEAETVLRRAVVSAPQMAEAHNNLGVVLHEQKRFKEAFMAFKSALEQDPDNADAYNNMGTIFSDQNQTDAALACYGKALALKTTYAEAYNNRGSVYQNLGNLNGAEEDFRRAIELKPGFLIALVNLGTVLHKKNRHAEAQALYERVLEIDPEHVQAHFALAEVLLYVAADLRRGWQEYTWRWVKPEFQKQWCDFACPLWSGEPLKGKTLLVWGEEGIGEEILYATMIPDLIALGAQVILLCAPRLRNLFQRSFPEIQCMAREDAVNPKDMDIKADYHCAAGDLSRLLRPEMAAFVGQSPILRADPAQTEALKRKYKSLGDGPLVGVAWHSKNLQIGWEKSIELLDLLTVFESRRLVLIDLQYGDTQAERNAFEAATGISLIHDETIDQMQDLDGFAAQVAAMDLVVSISNTTVHMAGGLGVPTWTLLSSAPLWRWFQGQDECRWYPSVRFFRQSTPGEWAPVLKAVRAAFDAWLENNK